jgi:hypothetical protein
MDDTNKDFAKELIKQYGEDRFYHCCNRTSNTAQTLRVYHTLNEDHDLQTCSQFFKTLNLPAQEWISRGLKLSNVEDLRVDLCRISFGFSRYWKEFGLKSYILPDHLHARMILGEKNEWVEKYIETIKKFKE